jgi:hypothetical protein
LVSFWGLGFILGDGHDIPDVTRVKLYSNAIITPYAFLRQLRERERIIIWWGKVLLFDCVLGVVSTGADDKVGISRYVTFAPLDPFEMESKELHLQTDPGLLTLRSRKEGKSVFLPTLKE